MATGAAQRVMAGNRAKKPERAKKPARRPTIDSAVGPIRAVKKIEEINILLAVALQDGLPIRKVRLDRGGLAFEGVGVTESLYPTYQDDNGDFVKVKHQSCQAWLIPQGVLVHFKNPGKAKNGEQLELVPLSKCLQISLVT